MSDISDIKKDIEQTRSELAAAVDTFATRLDVKAQLRSRVEAVRRSLREDDEARMRAALIGGGVLLLVVVRRRRRRRRERA